jgi:hypothetical protein
MSMRSIVGFLALAAACGAPDEAVPDAGVPAPDAAPAPDAEPVDPSEELFRPDHVLEVEIAMAPADWAALRAQPEQVGMPEVTCAEQPTEEPYTYFPAEITIDGETVADVAVRKKGNLGSLSTARPGLKVKANEYVAGQRISGLRQLTLNNNHQDPSYISQCLGYGLFRAAGLAAPRCSFAHVTVNGEDLGLYSHVESIKREFLERHFEDPSGHLYESGGDFSPGQTGGFQPKDDDAVPPDCSDLEPVVSALQASDGQLIEQLGAVVDLDGFLTYWAMEVLTDHWDGYANNRNNYYFYRDPTSGRFHFIPWGTDALFTGRPRTTRPMSVFACGRMAWRLYDVAATRDLYLARLAELLDSVWDESAIGDEIDRMEALIAPIADPTGALGLAGEMEKVRAFVAARRGVLEAELAGGPPTWPYAADESCLIQVGTVTGTFDTTWGTLDVWDAGAATTSGTVNDISIDSAAGHASAGTEADGKGSVRLLTLLEDGRYAVVFVMVNDPARIVPGNLSIDLANVAALMTFYDPETDTTWGGGLVLGGTLAFTSAQTTPGGPIEGWLSGPVFEL